MSNAEIIVIRRLDNGIYASSGGGQTAVWSRHASGPRGVSNAITAHYRERVEARRYYGSIGAGAGWVEVVPAGGQPGEGIRLDHPLFGMDADYLPRPAVGGESMSWWREQLTQATGEVE